MTRSTAPALVKSPVDPAATDGHDPVPVPVLSTTTAAGPIPGLAVSRPHHGPQLKLVVGGSADPAEREADDIADSVVGYLRRQASAVHESREPDGSAPADQLAGDRPPLDALRRQSSRVDVAAAVSDPADLLARHATTRRRVQLSRAPGEPQIGSAGGDLNPEMQQAITDAGPGSALRREIREPLESAMGADFSGVRVHTGPAVARLNRNLSARAFTLGSDLYFRDGLPDTGTAQGQHLLAHELAHTLQQGSVARKFSTGDRGRAETVRRVYTETPYSVSSTERKMFLEVHPIAWGTAGSAAAYAASKNAARPRAFLFETITTVDNIDRILGRYRLLTCPWDVALTVVLNGAWTPAKKYKDTGEVTSAKATKGEDNIAQQKALTKKAKEVIAGWNGPPLQIVTATWERRHRSEADALEVVQGSVPYTTLRKQAATNPGALTLETALSPIHDHVWHKMGDDDMPMPEPNPAVPTGEHLGLTAAEQTPGILDKTTLVTFGYDLTTAGTIPPITGILQDIYSKEMDLRDRIQELGAPIYPSEPTTFYRPTVNGEVTGMWTHAEKQHVGGSGQQLEGAKLTRSLQERKAGVGGQAKGPGYQQLAFHTIQVETSAGRRNDAIVQLLNGWWSDGNGDPDYVREKLLVDEINKLDQCALKKDEYLKKVYTNLKGDVENAVFLKIEPLVAEYQQQAVKEACDALRRELRTRQRAAHLAKKLLGV